MKKKLIIFPGNFIPHIGGLETHVDEFVKYLSKDKNYDITIFVPNVVNAKDKEIIHNNVKVIRYPAFELISNFPFPKIWSFKFWELFFGLYKKKFDIVMTRTRFFSNSTLGMIFAKFRLKRIKLVHVEHGSEFVKLESKFKSSISYLYDMAFGKLLFKISDKNIAISDTVKKFVCRNFIDCKKEDVPVIRRGIDIEIYEKINSDKEILKRFKGKTIMSFVGRLYKWKGVANSIDAYKNLPKNLQNKSVFLIIGYGEDYERLKKRAGKYIDNGIYFLGQKKFEDAISILKSSDIYVHSAYPGGGLSNSLLQAMKCGCAVIASPHEGANEVVNENIGILLKNNTVNMIASGMETLIQSENLRKKYVKNAKKNMEENFNWQYNIEKYVEIFNSFN